MRVIRILVAFCCLTITVDAESHRYVLTSAKDNIRVGEWHIANGDLGLKGAWSIRKLTLHGGRQEGVDLIVVDNGAIRLRIVPTRGMGILDLQSDDLRLGWDSPVKEVVHPQFIDLERNGSQGWLEGFNEWLVRCGLEFAGLPGTDKIVNNLGDETQMELTLHGKIANIPASEVEVVIDREPPHTIRVRGRVDERMFYGPQLELWTEISTQPGSKKVRIEDRITNRGALDQVFEIIYHTNFGSPLLEKGSRFVAAVERVTPFNAHAAVDVKRFDQYDGPAQGFIAQVYCLYPYAGPDDRTTILIQNAAGNRAASMSYSTAELPYLTLWKNTSAQEDGYVTGLEPGTNFAYNRRIERQAGRLAALQPGQTRTFAIDVQVHPSLEEAQQIVERIERIRSGRTTTFDTAPPAIQ